MKKTIQDNLHQSIQLKQQLFANEQIIMDTVAISEAIIKTFQNGGKVLFCGNGGSAADAQHLAAEFSGRYYYDRPPLYAEALHVNSSYTTAVSNDYSYDVVFARMIEAMGKTGDVLIGLSTSGNSANVVAALETAKKQGMICIGFTGKTGGKMKALCDICITIPSLDTPRIQECHMLLGHSICEIVESKIFPR